ncbi:MAG: FAD-dependent oxidoreductase, partial [Euryarchaeota archaeon]|nr:FAD-dependent oxidoreductase [Euryarchaeota archaeon]
MAARKKQRVVVCGAGFAGINVAKALESKCDVTLVAPTDRFVYLPLIHEVLSENVTPRTVTKGLDKILPKTTLVHGRAAKVEGKDLELASGDRLPFDTLVVAVGAESNDFGVPGVAENTLSFYSVGDALQANAMIKVAATQVQDRPLRVVVVGASFTGVEVAGEAAELLHKLDVPHNVLLLDAAPKVFPHQSAEFHQGIEKGLERLSLEMRLNQKIVEVRKNMVVVAGTDRPSEIPADVIFWCTGAKP